MNPFEAHGLDHLSPSSINSYAMSPAMWLMERVLKITSPVGTAAHRGTAVEEGIVTGLLGNVTDDACIEVAQQRYRTLTTLNTDPKKEQNASMLDAMVRRGLAELRGYGKPSATQRRVEHRFDGLQVPVIGYYDLMWENHGVLVDIKTTEKLPSAIKTSHARQVALYKVALSDNLDARLTYITPSKSATYRLENAREHANALHRIALAIQRFLAISQDPKELAELLAPDYDHFVWNDQRARQNGFELYGF